MADIAFKAIDYTQNTSVIGCYDLELQLKCFKNLRCDFESSLNKYKIYYDLMHNATHELLEKYDNFEYKPFPLVEYTKIENK